MKKVLGLVAVLVFMLLQVGCSTVPAGHKGIKVYLLGTNKGVDNEVLGVGRYWIGINEELYLYPTYQINYTFTKDATEGSENNEEFTFQTSEGMECSMDLGVALHFDDSKISKMFQTYRKGPDEIRGIVVRNSIRDALNKASSTMGVEHVYGEGKAKLIDTVQTMVKAFLDPSGIVIDKLSLIGSIRLPGSVKAALDSKVEATQRAQQRENELREAEAAAKKKIAEAEGEAKSNALKQASVTANILESKRLDNEASAIAKWDGKLPETFSAGQVPFVKMLNGK